ncbi:hypothetical protein CaCOL14_006128 [Colletotrichum acutatum]
MQGGVKPRYPSSTFPTRLQNMRNDNMLLGNKTGAAHPDHPPWCLLTFLLVLGVQLQSINVATN